MRQKKSKKIFYILAAVLLIVVAVVVTRDIDVKQEHVEEVLPNEFLNK